MTDQYCPSCSNKIVRPSGNILAPVLLIGEYPGKTEIQSGRPFATSTMFVTSGRVLRTELANAGLDFNDCRATNLWLHEVNDDDNCFQVGYEQALEEAKGRKAILLIGSLVVETFTSYKVSEVSGLQVDSSLLSCPLIYAVLNPAIVFAPGKGVGEVRQGIQKFVKRLEQEGII